LRNIKNKIKIKLNILVSNQKLKFPNYYFYL
jgi:hypothetical protein